MEFWCRAVKKRGSQAVQSPWKCTGNAQEPREMHRSWCDHTHRREASFWRSHRKASRKAVALMLAFVHSPRLMATRSLPVPSGPWGLLQFRTPGGGCGRLWEWHLSPLLKFHWRGWVSWPHPLAEEFGKRSVAGAWRKGCLTLVDSCSPSPPHAFPRLWCLLLPTGMATAGLCSSSATFSVCPSSSRWWPLATRRVQQAAEDISDRSGDTGPPLLPGISHQ